MLSLVWNHDEKYEINSWETDCSILLLKICHCWQLAVKLEPTTFSAGVFDLKRNDIDRACWVKQFSQSRTGGFYIFEALNRTVSEGFNVSENSHMTLSIIDT